jgi:hypothetical protein
MLEMSDTDDLIMKLRGLADQLEKGRIKIDPVRFDPTKTVQLEYPSVDPDEHPSSDEPEAK